MLTALLADRVAKGELNVKFAYTRGISSAKECFFFRYQAYNDAGWLAQGSFPQLDRNVIRQTDAIVARLTE